MQDAEALLGLLVLAMGLQAWTVLEDLNNARKGRRSPPPPKSGSSWRTPPKSGNGWMV